jgi:hypothetical protein
MFTNVRLIIVRPMGRRVFLISVASSLFASIAFAWLLEPIAKGIWHAGSESASVWFVHLQDAAFHNAALGKRDWVSTALFLYLFVFVSSGVAAFPIAAAIGVPIGRALRRSRIVRTHRGKVRRGLLTMLGVSTALFVILVLYHFGDLHFWPTWICS